MHRSLAGVLFVSALFAADNGVWKTAPAPPASWQRDRVADLTHRRAAAMEAIGDKGILILFAAEPRNYAGDVNWPFRQENDFFYLTGLTQPGATLVLLPGAKTREILFLPRANPQRESWTGHMLTPAEARQISGIQEVWEAGQFNPFVSTLIPRARGALQPAGAGGGRGARGAAGGGRGPGGDAVSNTWETEYQPVIAAVNHSEASLYMLLPPRPSPAEHAREQEFAAKLASVGLGIAIKDATEMFGKLRAVKSQREIEILQHAVDITAEAFQRAYTAAVPGTWEYEIQAQFEFTFLRRNAHWGYPCIVASGANATTLHYETNKDQMHDGDLLLMDDAAEFDGYSVDVTRTIPVNGRFTKEQSDIYRIVWEAQRAGFAMAKPGHSMSRGQESVNGAVTKVFKQGLYKLGLLTDPENDQQLRTWYFHGIGHGIGLNVHDPGSPELQPGEVVTVEPGIYIRPDALDNLPKTPENEKFIAAVRPAFEKYRGIGVRIEDDVLITNGEPKVISAGIPSKLEEVEAAIAQQRKTVKTAPLP
jgi:Xaa-Pro aminopeptidase